MASDQRAIRELKYRYCYAVDRLDTEALLEVFTEDVAFELGIYGEGTGHDGVREYMDWYEEHYPGVRAHQVVHPLIDVDGDRAEGRWYYLVLYERPDGSFELGQGTYDDRYRRVDGAWKIASFVALRRLTHTF